MPDEPQSQPTVELLEGLSLFERLDEGDLVQLAGVSLPRSFCTGEVVFREGDDSDTCYVVRSGMVRATREHSDGRTLTLATFGPGEVFGEMAAFDQRPRSATIDAVVDTELVAILGADMRRLLREHIEITFKLAEALVERLRTTDDRLARQSFQSVQSRVAAVLAQMVELARGEQQEGDGILLTATQAEIAQLAGSSRESASRFLAVLERSGIISQGRGRLLVQDAEALERYVY
jgi:CRP/FNR family transcriptional regulator